MVQDLIGTLLILIGVLNGTVGERNEMGITKEVETCSVLANRLRDLEKGMRLNSQRLQDEIDSLKFENDNSIMEINKLKFENDNSRMEINKLKFENDNSRMEISNLQIENDNSRKEIIKLKQGLMGLKGDQGPDFTLKQPHVSLDKLEDHTKQRKNMTSRFQRYLLNGLESPLGFTAYADHVIQHLGVDQTIKFNDVLFNDGGAYNNASGIFTCPVNGVYLFFFEVGNIANKQIVAKLVANNVNEVDAIADTTRQANEAQGSNMAILRLRQGTHVWVENYRWADQDVVGGPIDHFSTFSGILLYRS